MTLTMSISAKLNWLSVGVIGGGLKQSDNNSLEKENHKKPSANKYERDQLLA
jgi:hypothetical protein